MREIVVNGRFLARRVSGVERYGREVLRRLQDRCRVEAPLRHGSGWAGHAWEQLVLPARLEPGSVLWSPANTGPLLTEDQVLTLHDLSPLEHPDWFRRGFAAWYRLLLPLLAPRVRRIIVPSQFVRQGVLRRFRLPDVNVVTIPPGVDASRFRPGGVSDSVRRYILFVGTLEPRKNLRALLRAWQQIQDEYRELSLVIAGDAGRVFRNPGLPEAHDRVEWLGYVAEEDLPRVYAGARLLVLPSWHEGFGLTAVEAMACGTPVLVSDGGALPEVVGDAAMIFSLADPGGLARALSELLSRPELRVSLSAKGLERAQCFSWQTTADLVWEQLNAV